MHGTGVKNMLETQNQGGRATVMKITLGKNGTRQIRDSKGRIINNLPKSYPVAKPRLPHRNVKVRQREENGGIAKYMPSKSALFSALEKMYDEEQAKLLRIYEGAGQGAVREATGDLHESMIDLLIGLMPNYTSTQGTADYLERKVVTATGEILKEDNIQVDRHIKKNGEYYAFIEAKTYLDASFLSRAVGDLVKIWKSLKQTKGIAHANRMHYIVFVGQDAISENKRKILQAEFFEMTGCEMKIFCVEEGKRTSKKPLYKNKFLLNEKTVNSFLDIFV